VTLTMNRPADPDKPKTSHLFCPCLNLNVGTAPSSWIAVCGQVIHRSQSAFRPGVDVKCRTCMEWAQGHDHFDGLV